MLNLLAVALLAAVPFAEGQAAVSPSAANAQAVPEIADYAIGPQDILKVTVYGLDDLTQTIVVQADGTFTYPLIGRVSAQGLTTKQLEAKITTALASGYVRNPQVTVVVQEFRSKTVFVVGELARPGTYPLSGKLTLVEILGKAGPMNINAGAEVVVVRPPAGLNVSGPTLPTDIQDDKDGQAEAKGEVFRINIQDLQSGTLQKNLELRPNDTVFVPQAPKIFVSGEVRNPGAYPWFPGMTARQLISVAGGLTPEGSDGRLKVVRDKAGKSREDGIKLDEAVKAGETLVVRRRIF